MTYVKLTSAMPIKLGLLNDYAVSEQFDAIIDKAVSDWLHEAKLDVYLTTTGLRVEINGDDLVYDMPHAELFHYRNHEGYEVECLIEAAKAALAEQGD